MPDTLIYIITTSLLFVLFGLGVWIVRQSMGTDKRMLHHRRLTLVDTVPIDRRRKLVLLRRDDIEHLVMTGGPVDVIVESGITPRARLPHTIKDMINRGQHGLEEPTLLTEEVPPILRHKHPN
ncbi:MAG: flagellar biosynthetic protein FliO [Alphaproteobacteria bacterium]